MTEAEAAVRPISVDADTTLLGGGVALECLIAAVRRHPLILLALPLWALRGGASLKRQVALRAALDPATLPYNLDAVGALRAAAAHGAPVELVTSADESAARAIASHFGFFTAIEASTPARPLSAAGRRALLASRAAAGHDCVSAAPPRLRPRHIVAIVRPAQWLKNTLVFLPFLLAHDLRSVSRWLAAFLAFAAFSAAASIGYVLNDVFDRYQDRLHPRRRARPLASGEMPLEAALLVPIPLAAIAAACCAFLHWPCAAVLAWYLAATAVYSAVLKERLMADVIILALLYTSRLLFGSFATGNIVSPWLAGFSVMLFLSLALCKRVSELIVWRSIDCGNALGRSYHVDDIPVLEMMAVASGFLACLIMTLYVQSPEIVALYRRPYFLWGAIIGLLYWLGRLFLYTHRGKCPDDPLLFAIEDRTTRAVLAVAGLFVIFAV